MEKKLKREDGFVKHTDNGKIFNMLTYILSLILMDIVCSYVFISAYNAWGKSSLEKSEERKARVLVEDEARKIHNENYFQNNEGFRRYFFIQGL